MPATYRIEKKLGIVYTTVSGRVTDDEAREHQQALAKDTDFRPDLRQLFDTHAVTDVQLTAQGMRVLVMGNPFGKGAKRAFVTSIDHLFGLARMFEMGRVNPLDQFRVLRSMDEARAWLGLPPE